LVSTASKSDYGGVILHFSDGTIHKADVLVGADGIKSAVRSFVEVDAQPLRFSKTFAYRGLIPTDEVKASGVKTDLTIRPVCYIGKHKHIITFPIKNNRTINVVAFSTHHDKVFPTELPHPWVSRVAKQELIDDFKDWGNDALSLLGCIDAPSRWSIHYISPLSSFNRGRIVLIGDSAHGMLPHLGGGVGQGFEDVLLLSELMTHPETRISNITEVLQAYSTIRVPRANMVLRGSAAAGHIYENYFPGGYSYEEVKANLQGIWQPVWYHNLEDDMNAAIKLLEEQGHFRRSTTVQA